MPSYLNLRYDGTQNYLVFQTIQSFFWGGVGGGRGSKGLSDEIVKSTPTTANILNPLLNYVGTKIRVKFKGSCLKQHEISSNRGKIVNIYIFYEINKNLNISS